jgi:ferredoxin/flavodoxin---NADP+ reductase
VTHVITQSCCNDASCVSACPVNCIHPTPDDAGYATAEMLYIDPDGCVDCGECVAACPVDAIVADNDLLPADQRYLEISSRFFADPAHKPYSSKPEPVRIPRIEVSDRRLRVAVVGAGPAGCFAAEQLLSCQGIDVEVHVFDRLPTPWGLVRFGVAPDHQRTKLMAESFERTAGRGGVELHLNVEVGQHIAHHELLAHHHAVIYTVGAPGDVKLNIPGEVLPGSHSATEFVAWYNGHPDFAEQSFDLSAERAVVVGNGNVALDVARVLASEIDYLASTDIADHALEALARSGIREVVVLGRRGLAQAAFTTAELMGLVACEGFEVVVDDGGATRRELDSHDMGAVKASILAELPRRPMQPNGKRVVLRFLGSPVEVLGDDRVRGLRIVRNELIDDARIARPTNDLEDLDCGVVLRSIGYRGVRLPELPFDDARGTLPNDRGRVIEPATDTPVLGVYTAGWIKRGPSGVIGTNKKCAQETVETLLDDYSAGRLAAPAQSVGDLRTLIATRQAQTLDYQGWQAIDRQERRAAQGQLRPRVKFTSVADMFAAASAVASRG